MSLFILDTDHVSLLQRSHPAVSERFLSLPLGRVATTIVTVEEQFRGRLKAIRRAANGPELPTAYERARATVEFFRDFPLVDFDATAHEHFRGLRAQKIRVGSLDLRIAAIVLASRDGILVTRNARDFSQVPGLPMEDWSS